MEQMTIDSAIELRDRGIQQAVEHAEEITPNWKELALSFLETYAHSHFNFAGEDIRAAAEGIVPTPPSLRAWGSVIKTAAMRGWIIQIGFHKCDNPKAHRANAARWQSRLTWIS
jgi:hypothetical protein